MKWSDIINVAKLDNMISWCLSWISKWVVPKKAELTKTKKNSKCLNNSLKRSGFGINVLFPPFAKYNYTYAAVLINYNRFWKNSIIHLIVQGRLLMHQLSATQNSWSINLIIMHSVIKKKNERETEKMSMLNVFFRSKRTTSKNILPHIITTVVHSCSFFFIFFFVELI